MAKVTTERIRRVRTKLHWGKKENSLESEIRKEKKGKKQRKGSRNRKLKMRS